MSQQFSAVRLILAAKVANAAGDLGEAQRLLSGLPSGTDRLRVLNQRQKRKNRRRRHAVGDQYAFTR